MDHLSSTTLMCAILLLFYASGTVKGVALGDGCTLPSGGTPDPCTTTEAKTECSDRVTSGTFVCECKSEFYKSGTDCIARKNPAADCTGDQCVANAACNSGNKCACNTGYTEIPTTNPTSCKTVVAFGGDCTSNACTEDNTECSSNACVCTGTSFRDTTNSACVDRKTPTADCATDQCVANAKCTNLKCVCNTGYTATPTATPTSCKSSDAATIMLAHMHVFIFGTVASLYFLV